MKNLIIGLLSIVLLSSCTANIARKYAEMPEYVREQPAIHQQITHHEGSLWNNTESNLFSDIKARHVGDIVTIVVNEQAVSSNSSSTKIASSSSGQSGLTTFFGLQHAALSAINAKPGNGGITDFSSSNSYKGSGQNKVDNSFTATISARVIKVLPNHKLFIRGEKQIFTNGEENTIIITGIIDEYQISNDDTINSMYISDAKIFYNGKGIVSSTRNEGWLIKLWNLIKPF